MQDPEERNFWGLLKDRYMEKSGLGQVQRNRQGLMQAQNLVGTRRTPYELDESQKFDSTDSAHQMMLRSLPSTNPNFSPEQNEQILAQNQASLNKPNFMNKGTGLIGGEITPAEFYGGLMSTQGYKQIGAQGLINMANNAAALKQAAATNALKPKFGMFDNYKDYLTTQSDMNKRAASQLASSRKSMGKFEAATSLVNKRKGFKNFTGADDTVLMKNFASMILPTESVMGDDIGIIATQEGIPAEARSIMIRLSGGGQMDEEERQKIYNTMVTLGKQSAGENASIRSTFNADIKQAGFNKDSVFRKPYSFNPYVSLPDGFVPDKRTQ